MSISQIPISPWERDLNENTNSFFIDQLHMTFEGALIYGIMFDFDKRLIIFYKYLEYYHFDILLSIIVKNLEACSDAWQCIV